MTTATLIDDIEARLAAEVSGIQVGQFYDGIALAPATKQHMGCTVLLPVETEKLEEYSTRDEFIWGEHEVRVQYGYLLALEGSDAKTSRTSALGFHDDIREALVGPDSWSRQRHAQFKRHELAKVGGLLVGTFTFTFQTEITQ